MDNLSILYKGILDALDYIEENLTEDLSTKEIAEKAYVSEFHFQRIFSVLCGFTVGEYIRNRRLSLSGTELSTGKVKVIDIAIKYGYESPDSFTRAFTKFHGIKPSEAKEKGAKLRNFAPLKINITFEGATIMEYKIEEKSEFTVMGIKRNFMADNSYELIPKFWDEYFNSENPAVMGKYGLCIDSDGSSFDYYIADDYIPSEPVPEGYETRNIKAGTWAIFPCTLGTLQDTNTKMWKEWLPNCREYKLGANYNIELYSPLNQENPQSSYCELWLPIEKI